MQEYSAEVVALYIALLIADNVTIPRLTLLKTQSHYNSMGKIFLSQRDYGQKTPILMILGKQSVPILKREGKATTKTD